MANRNEIEGIGLDVELDTPLDEELFELVCSARERRWLSSYAPGDDGRYAKILFSVKEAAFKCQFPITREFIEYSKAEITLNFDRLSFCVAVPRASPEASRICSNIHGRFQVESGFIFSGATILPTRCQGSCGEKNLACTSKKSYRSCVAQSL
ncbi:4'-phosphopantetheinyl transferase superfamily protein [Desulfoplanes sp.]